MERIREVVGHSMDLVTREFAVGRVKAARGK